MISQTESKKDIQKLIDKYETLKKSGTYESFLEQETCDKLILPLFAALGWDIQGDKIIDEVKPQAPAGGQKRVDYAFKVNSVPVMFLEAKKLDEDLDNPKFAHQTINYGYHQGVRWVILSDFEGIKVFNATLETKEIRKRLIIDLKYTDYLTKYSELWLLSKESLFNDELNKYAKAKGHVINREPINEIILKNLLVWRNKVIKSIKELNARVSGEEAAECTQKLLNRMIFIRTCEDRGFEQGKKILREAAKEWQNNSEKRLYIMLREIFTNFFKGYDSGLFEEHLLDTVKISDEILYDIICGLYEDRKEEIDEFDFAAIDADILGSIYEQYLGTIQKGEDLKGKEKRKSQGIYYTPKYIVDYIVKNTLGKVLNELLKNKEYAKIGKLKVLDPACGSGSFLLKTLEVFDDAYKKTQEFAKLPKGRKIKALCNNIYGVDLDAEAVELTNLNLLLSSTYSRKKLPNLSHNIECGNSLIDDQKIAGDRAFDWNKRFKEVMDKGGFDVIIGNPPYIKEYTNKSAFDGLHDSPYYQGKMDIWTLFACTAIDKLIDGGILCFIAPNNWITNAGASIFRDKILKEGEIIEFFDFGDFKVFQEAGIQTMIFIFKKCKPKKSYNMKYSKINNRGIAESDLLQFLVSKGEEGNPKISTYDVSIRPSELMRKFISFNKPEEKRILQTLYAKKNFQLLKDEIGQGIVCPQETVIADHLSILKDVVLREGIFVLSNRELKSLRLNKEEATIIRPYYTSDQINRYLSESRNNAWIIYSDKTIWKHISKYPNIKRHLDRYSKIITSDFKPYGLHRARDERLFEGNVIMSIRKTDIPRFSFVDFPAYVSQTYFIIKTERINLKYLTGLLNSKLVYYWLKYKGKVQGDLLQVDKEPLMQIPIYLPSTSMQMKMSRIVDKRYLLGKQYLLVKEKKTSETEQLKRKIDETDKEIDDLVYELYGLTKEEIKVVESADN